MTLVEQAVFTSAETDRSSGYQLLGQSEGISEGDARQLRVWCPSHDSLAELDPDSYSVNFHPLPSGSFCVSQSTSAGWEYSDRGGHRVYTQCLVVPPKVLRRFANNPFAILRAAEASGLMKVLEEVPATLPSLHLIGRAGEVDQDLLARLATESGPRNIALFVQAARDSIRLAIAGRDTPQCLIPTLFSCLPLECRTAFSFSTALKYSSRRPFRILALLGDDAERRWVGHQGDVSLLDLDSQDDEASMPLDGWSQFVYRVLSSGRTSLLARELSKDRPDLLLDDLPALGLQLLEDFDNSQPFSPTPSPEEAGETSEDIATDNLRHAHAAHDRFVGGGQSAATAEIKKTAPSSSIDAHSPEVLHQLEYLDDVVFDAISGKDASLASLKTLWPQVSDSLGEDLLADSREQYIRYALTIWEEGSRKDIVRNPARAVRALEVLCILFGQP